VSYWLAPVRLLASAPYLWGLVRRALFEKLLEVQGILMVKASKLGFRSQLLRSKDLYRPLWDYVVRRSRGCLVDSSH
jgi:hypothetical protein